MKSVLNENCSLFILSVFVITYNLAIHLIGNLMPGPTVGPNW